VAQFDALAEARGWDLTADTYSNAFGSWNAAKELVGGIARPRGFQRSTNDQMDRNADDADR
jgi:hypothetical protein